MKQTGAAAGGHRYRLGAALLAVLLYAGPQAAKATMTPPAPLPAAPKVMLRLEQPLTHTQVTSPFGWRYHPVLRRKRQHKGVDYAATAGTPVHAAQDGSIVAIGRRHGDGLYIRIRHAGDIQTAYAHLSHFASGLHRGSAVHCGEVIGAVGATGTTTGPHLHYEVLVNGRQVDPQLHDARLPVLVAELR